MHQAMSRTRSLITASLLAYASAGHAASDAEVRQWLDELVGSALVLQELAAGHCSEFLRDERIDVDRWYAWGASLASPAARASTVRAQAELMTQARASVGQWVASEFRRLPQGQPLQKSCRIYAGVFRTIRDAAEAELEDIEYQLRGRVTPRPER